MAMACAKESYQQGPMAICLQAHLLVLSCLHLDDLHKPHNNIWVASAYDGKDIPREVQHVLVERLDETR